MRGSLSPRLGALLADGVALYVWRLGEPHAERVVVVERDDLAHRHGAERVGAMEGDADGEEGVVRARLDGEFFVEIEYVLVACLCKLRFVATLKIPQMMLSPALNNPRCACTRRDSGVS